MIKISGTTGIYMNGASITDASSIEGILVVENGVSVANETQLGLKANTEDINVANSSLVKTALNASGTAPIYACRAWVNFNGTGTVAIRASGNVSSITDNGTADYSVNFLTAMPDAYYSVVGIVQRNQTFNGDGNFASIKASSNYDSLSITSARVQTTDALGALLDPLVYCVSIFR